MFCLQIQEQERVLVLFVRVMHCIQHQAICILLSSFALRVRKWSTISIGFDAAGLLIILITLIVPIQISQHNIKLNSLAFDNLSCFFNCISCLSLQLFNSRRSNSLFLVVHAILEGSGSHFTVSSHVLIYVYFKRLVIDLVVNLNQSVWELCTVFQFRMRLLL